MNIIVDVYKLAGTSTEVSVVEHGEELCFGYLAAVPASSPAVSPYTVFIRHLDKTYAINRSLITNIHFDGPILIINVVFRS